MSLFSCNHPADQYTIIKPAKEGGGVPPFERFETELENKEGSQFYLPWNEMRVYDVRRRQNFETMKVLSKNGLDIHIDLSIIHHPIHSRIGHMEGELGEDYYEQILKPAIKSVTREVIGEYKAEELYSTKREEIEDQIFNRTLAPAEENNIQVPDLYIRDVTLPETLKTAIEQKLKQEQQSFEYDFKIEKEQKEATRKEIEAEGIAEFQKIINRTITPDLLKWKGVEATQEISKAPNSKVIVIGNGDGGLPIILGGE